MVLARLVVQSWHALSDADCAALSALDKPGTSLFIGRNCLRLEPRSSDAALFGFEEGAFDKGGLASQNEPLLGAT